MEGTSSLLLSYSSSSFTSILRPQSDFTFHHPSSSSGKYPCLTFITKCNSWPKNTALLSLPRATLRTSAFALEQEEEEAALLKSKDSFSTPPLTPEMLPKIDKSGRFCSPRSARELALSVIYASCLEGSDPVRHFEKRMNVRREPGYEFDKASLLEYNHMSFGGPPVKVETVEEADQLLRNNEKESAIESEVLAAPPKLVYSKLILRFTRKLLVSVVDRWDSHVIVIEKIAPPNWKSEPAGRILELCILHLAMSEIAVLETRHQIVINEAVDLAKRFCDGAAPRIINGCLRTFVKDFQETNLAQASEGKKEIVS